jgi:hypothetical protein
LENAKSITMISEIAGIEEISGHPDFYRIKFDYRYRIFSLHHAQHGVKKLCLKFFK